MQCSRKGRGNNCALFPQDKSPATAVPPCVCPLSARSPCVGSDPLPVEEAKECHFALEAFKSCRKHLTL